MKSSELEHTEKLSQGTSHNLSESAQEQMGKVFEWFNSNVSRLETAYTDIGMKFDQVSQELADKNRELVRAFMDNDAIKTQLHSVLESLNSGVIMVDVQENITLYNPAAERIYNVPVAEALGKPFRDIFPQSIEEQEMDSGEHPLLQTLRKKKEYTDGERYLEVFRNEDVRRKPVGFRTSVVRDPNGEVLGAVEISTDLTQMKQMQNQVQHANTLSAIGQMAATVAHEIRNPLGGIGGFAGLLERDIEEGDPRRPLVTKIVQGVSSLNKIVSNLLVFSRPMELQPRPVLFVEWLDEILRYTELEAGRTDKEIEFEKEYPTKDFMVHIDPEKFQQVLLNLTFNGIQAIPYKGKLIISTHMTENGLLRVSIRDTGKGIPAKVVDKIFDPFFTTREQGTGLGLAIVKRIIELHGGNISVSSEPDCGTEFVITLEVKNGMS